MIKVHAHWQRKVLYCVATDGQDISTQVCGRKVLICGNHDTDHNPMKILCEYFDEVYSLYKWHEFWLSHCPIHPDELRGKLNIHGHVHHATINDKRYFNTSLEISFIIDCA